MSPWKGGKVAIFRKITRQMGVDIFGGVEVGNNWSMIRSEQHIDKLLNSEIESRIVYGSNPNKIIMYHQHGGTCVGEINRVATYSLARNVYISGLVLWLYIVLRDKDDHTICIVAAYII